MKKSLKLVFGFSGVALASTFALTLTSCSSQYESYQKAKVVNMPTFKLGQLTDQPGLGNDQHNAKYNSVASDANVDIKDLIYGTNSFNDGKYVFIYGTVGYYDVHIKKIGNDSNYNFHADYSYAPFYKWLTRQENTDEKLLTDYSYFQDMIIGNTFFDAWFNDVKENRSPYQKAKIVMYLDIPPVTPGADKLEDFEKFMQCSPYETWDDEEIRYLYQWTSLKNGLGVDDTLQFEDLPINWKMLSGTYIRQDEGAKAYREFVSYVQQYRPNMSTVTNADGGSGGMENLSKSGMIAFNTTSKNPLSYTLDSASIVSDSTNFQYVMDDTAGETWKQFYALYFAETWDHAIGEQGNKKPEGESESTYNLPPTITTSK